MRAIAACSLIALCLSCVGNIDKGFGTQCKQLDDGGTICVPAGSCYTRNVWMQDNATLLTSPQIRLIFWGDFWFANDQLGQMSQEWNTVANDPAFYAPLSEYGINPGSLSGIYLTNENITNEVVSGTTLISETAIQNELSAEISGGALPQQTNNSIYVIMMPPGIKSLEDGANKFSGHHYYYGDSVVYAVVEYNNASSMGVVASHEIYESATDPYFDGWNGGSGYTEVGDLCSTTYYTLDGYTMQTVWGQNECGCVPITVAADAGTSDVALDSRE